MFKHLIHASKDLIGKQDSKGTILYISPSIREILDYDSDEIVGKNIIDLIHADDHRIMQLILSHSEIIDQPDPVVIRMNNKSGQSVWMQMYFTRIQRDSSEDTLSSPQEFAFYARDITGAQLDRIALKELLFQAQSATLAKSEFLASLSHEIRTPLNTIIGLTTLLSQTGLDQKQEGLVDTLGKSGKHLLSLINDILDFSKIEAGKLEIEEREVNVHECLEDLVTLFENKAKDKGLSLHRRVQPGIPATVRCDCVRIRQVLVNLLSNAIKFTEKGGVTLQVSSSGLEKEGEIARIILEFKVTDTGRGIAQNQLPKIFEPFKQAGRIAEKADIGTGLGLAISSKIADALGGFIKVQSQIGRGSTFSFSVPVIEVTAGKRHSSVTIPLTPLPQYESDEASESAKNILSELTEEEIEQRRQTPILMVEDNSMNREVMYLLLEELHYEPDMAHNGNEAVEMVSCKAYDMVLMDVMMPGMDGYEATREIKKMLGKNAPVIIAMTANAFKEDRDKCLQAGMDDYIAKPINVELLKSMLEKYSKKASGGTLTSGKDATKSAKPAWKKAKMEREKEISASISSNNISTLQELKEEEKKAKTNRKLVTNVQFFKRFNPSTMEMLSEHVSDPRAFIMELTDIFVKDAPKTLQKIKNQIKNDNYEQAGIAAHSLKGNCRMVGAMDLAAICEHIDMSIRAGARRDFSDEINELEEDFFGIIDEIKFYRKSLSQEDF